MSFEGTTKKIHLEMLRILAIAMVIFNHSDGYVAYFSNTANIFTYFYSIVFSILCRAAVPLFFMVSGIVLLDKQESLGELFKKRILRIIVIIVSFSLFYYLLDITRKAEMSFSFLVFLRKLASGDVLESFWFLYAYLGFLIILPFLREIARGFNMKLLGLLLCLQLMFGIMPGILPVMGIPALNNLFILGQVVFFPLAGYGLEKYFTERGMKKRIVIFSVLAVIISICLIVFLLEWQKQKTGFYQYRYLDTLAPVFAIAFYSIGKNIGGYTSAKMARRIVILGESTFLVYLLEKAVAVIWSPVYRYLSEATIGIIANTVQVLAVLVSAYGIAILLRKVRFIRRI